MATDFDRFFLIRLASVWLACRLAVMGGHPQIPQHQPVKDFRSLGWALLGCIDYATEMRILTNQERQGEVVTVEAPKR